ncbi:hypothetical protein [Oharaeibacter diazotrophicus]|uniref:Uncharacterized protein n=1 Tax=Oharaeibacter diazotrophicus TaxID=1920512 RepID=A0A4R6R6E2_9HYPH|nr:hypothetical protein [Oharaeibacter diazotrophicus]TDP81521.1 hypothetical protein EDD54_4391 [Oharaeibacter diazotrophicus]BBE73759.1 hypothetical protein OHA_1_03375 [Pleomorphomonas sp. SM30]GLS75549.1 hypothetical protein GCM10007904_08840 [Oharaeibacter diazotrophicus]
MSDIKDVQTPERLIERALRHASTGPAHPAKDLMRELATVLQAALAREEEVRKAAYLDGVRSAVKVVREKKEAIRSQTGDGSAEEVGAVHDEVTTHIADIANEGRVSVDGLVRLVARLEDARADAATLDRDVVRAYYALVNRGQPTSADVLPNGRPTESLDIALAIATRLLPAGWWSLGATFDVAEEVPTAMVGADQTDEQPPRKAARPARALLAATFAAVAARGL